MSISHDPRWASANVRTFGDDYLSKRSLPAGSRFYSDASLPLYDFLSSIL